MLYQTAARAGGFLILQQRLARTGENRMKWMLLPMIVLVTSGCGTGVDIWKAVEKEDLAAIRKYTEKGGNLETGANSFHGKTPLWYALELRKKDSYLELLKLGANPDTPCRNHASVMLEAAFLDDGFWLDEAIKAGGDVNRENVGAKPQHQMFPLRNAIIGGSLNNVKRLCEAGADLNHVDNTSGQPLVIAGLQDRFDIALYLLEKGADYLTKADKWHTFIAVIRNQMVTIKNLTEKERNEFNKVIAWLKSDGFDPETAVWDGEQWKQP